MILPVVAVTLVVVASVPAQTSSSRMIVSGIVEDEAGAVLSGARVVLRKDDGTQERSTTSGESGAFRFDKVSDGTYEIRAEHEGFNTGTVRVTVTRRSPASLTIKLTVGELRQEMTVTVSSEKISIDPNENRDISSVDRKALDNLPVYDQDIVGALSQFLNSGAVGTNGVTLVVDGMEATKAGVSASAIQGVKINNNPYSAEFSRPGRGRIEIITKPGSTEYHGMINFVFRDYRLNARDPFSLTIPTEQRRIYEGNLTGPVGKSEKTSFLISVNREEEDLQSTVFAQGLNGPIQVNVPTPRRNTEFALRLTRQMTAKTTFSVHYSFQDRTIENQGVGGFNLPEVASNNKLREDLLRFNHSAMITPTLVNQCSVLLGRYGNPTESVNKAPKVVVQDAFTGGGAQADQLRTENHWTLNEILSWSHKKHMVKAGVQVPDYSRRGSNDHTNSLGTFYFSTLEDYQRQQPYSFTAQRGEGHLIFWEVIWGTFVMDEIRLRSNLSVSAGLRYDWQNYFHDNNNFSPRVSFAYAPGKGGKTVIRGGVGIFYDRTGPSPISDILRFDGQRLKRYVLTDPGFPDPLSPGQSLTEQPTSIVRLSPDVKIPYTLQYGIAVERQLQKSTTMTFSYIGTRGVDQFRSRDVNAPLPPLFSVRPDPRFSVIRQIESTADLKANSLEIGLRGNITNLFNGMAQYVLGRSYNNTSGIGSFPANNYDVSSEWGRADFDERHRFNLLGTINPGKLMNLGVALSLVSGRPYSLTTGRDDNRDDLAIDRPAGVGRNTLQGPGNAQLDLRWSYNFYLIKSKKDKGPTLTPAVDAFNVFNRVNYVSYVGNLSSPFFGQAVAARPPRRLQLSLRLTF